MSFPRHIFKAYDIRGLVEEEITESLAKQIGLAYAKLRRQEVDGDSFRVAVGRDMRPSSIVLQRALMEGLVEAGVQVLDIGLVSTPAFYFGVGHLKADGGIMVSASHNPAEYNGFKLTREMAIPVAGDTGISQMADLIANDDLAVGEVTPGSVEVVDGIVEKAVEAEMVHAGEHALRPMKIVADTANGMGAQFLDVLFDRIEADVTRLYWEFDGTFPNHEADPFKVENTEVLREKVVELGADIGIATDGDGDRIFFIDNKGEMVNPAIVRGLLAQIVLKDAPGATICYDIRPGKITRDMIEEAGGVPSVTRVGHSLIKAQMRREGAVFGGESSGHTFYAFETGVYEGPVTATMQMLQEMTRQEKPLSEIVAPLDRYAHSGEINFRVEDKEAMIAKIKAAYEDGFVTDIDGVTFEYESFWFNVRPSNTESKLRLNLEAVDEAVMIEKRDALIALLTSDGGERIA